MGAAAWGRFSFRYQPHHGADKPRGSFRHTRGEASTNDSPSATPVLRRCPSRRCLLPTCLSPLPCPLPPLSPPPPSRYGSGGSTLAFAPMARRAYSVEHSAEWCERMRDQLAAHNLTDRVMYVCESVPRGTGGWGITDAYEEGDYKVGRRVAGRVGGGGRQATSVCCGCAGGLAGLGCPASAWRWQDGAALRTAGTSLAAAWHARGGERGLSRHTPFFPPARRSCPLQLFLPPPPAPPPPNRYSRSMLTR